MDKSQQPKVSNAIVVVDDQVESSDYRWADDHPKREGAVQPELQAITARDDTAEAAVTGPPTAGNTPSDCRWADDSRRGVNNGERPAETIDKELRDYVKDDQLMLDGDRRTKLVAVLNSYKSFWKHISFRFHPEKAPSSSFRQMKPYLYVAAELVTRIRTWVDEEGHRGLNLRKLDGNATEFLFNWFDPESGAARQNAEEFIRGVVHYTLRDTTRYVDGLNKDQIDEALDEFLEDKKLDHL